MVELISYARYHQSAIKSSPILLIAHSPIVLRNQLMPWFVKIEEGIVDKPTFDLYVPAHLAFVQDLIHRGHHAQTGYWKEKGGGMLLFQAESMAEAEAIVARDPLVINHCVKYKLHEWHIVMGDPTGMEQCDALYSVKKSLSKSNSRRSGSVAQRS
jgi:uncharacterized protein YciI